ncbi:MAG: PqqD family protein [Prevotellaceae bacterium]|jgi:hypothetical protein|nr:PqqD family protein [Prevotellaceae bacterium]
MNVQKGEWENLIPCIDRHITTENEGELSVITFPRFRSKFMQKYFVPKNKSAVIRIRLEEHGTAVWNLIDGNRTVSDIIDILAGYFDNEKNYEYRIITYIVQLHKQGFVKLKKK